MSDRNSPAVELPEGGDVEMGGGDEVGSMRGAQDDPEPSTLQGFEAETPKTQTFLDFLRSPIVEIAVTDNTGEVTILSAHEALVKKAPYFAEKCAEFDASGADRRIDLQNEDLRAVGSVLEYVYNGDYFPRRIGDDRHGSLEHDPTLAHPDTTGAALLRHAKVYTLADKLGMPALRSLAHSKIHRTTSTARGEIAYARYVYQRTSKDDTTIRRPVAAFWATRSHVLRHEADEEFRAMCLEFPQFAFDVLSLVLDQKEKRGDRHAGLEKGSTGGPASGSTGQVVLVQGERSTRKRPRHSQG